MRPVQGGTQKLTMNSAEKDYQQLLRQSSAQADGNPFVAGIQEVFDMGAGQAAKNTRTKYGNVNLMPQELLQGATANFQCRRVQPPYEQWVVIPSFSKVKTLDR